MPLASLAPELERARQQGYAVPLFDTFDALSAEGMLAAIAEQRAPGAIALYAHTVERPNARALSAYIRARAEELPQPVSLMLDHGQTLDQCLQAIALGFTDVMYDGSSLPLDENIANTQAVVRAAHAAGAGVEAELGHVGLGSEYQAFGGQRQGFTDPAVVERFAAETGVDYLAVAFGTAHGLYAGEPCLDLALLREIRARVDIPLVMHGGTGLSAEQFRAAIAAGIAKVNVATDLFVTAGRRLVEAAGREDASYFGLSEVAAAAFRERCAFYLELLGAAGRA